jgi:AcrR family transcriptional regulator
MLWVGAAAGEIRRHPPFFKEPLDKKTSDKKPLDTKTLHKQASRKPRSDALRNRDRVLEAARTVFSAGGPKASLEAVAKAAGVGIGTLYRHFPTREALFEAVYRREVQQLADLAKRLEEEAEPIEALREWMRSFVKFVVTKRGMSAALAFAVSKDSDLVSHSFERLTRAIGLLLEQAIAAGVIRSDISPEDLLRAIVGMCYTHDEPGWQKNVLRLVDIFVDGLCVRPAKRQRR